MLYYAGIGGAGAPTIGHMHSVTEHVLETFVTYIKNAMRVGLNSNTDMSQAMDVPPHLHTPANIPCTAGPSILQTIWFSLLMEFEPLFCIG